MARRAPLDDRELLKLLEAGHYLEVKPDAENWEETEGIIEQLSENLKERE